MNDNDDLTGIFDDLTPADFARTTSARYVSVMDKPSMADFVPVSLDMLRFGYHAADGLPNPVSILVGPEGRHMYSPDDDETLGDFVKRLGREAKEHHAHTVFTSVLTEGGPVSAHDGSSVDSPEALQKAASEGAVRPCLYWYAQVNDEIRHGIMAIDDAGNTGEVFEAPPAHASPIYRSILGG